MTNFTCRYLNIKMLHLFSMCLFKRWKVKNARFTVMLYFIASLFSRQNCLDTQEFSFCRRTKQCISKTS